MKKLFKIMLVAAMIVTGMAVAQHAQAQKTDPPPGTIVIEVVDAADEPIEGATVVISVKGTDVTLVTDVNGVAIFQNVPPGTYIVVVGMDGYNPVLIGNVDVTSNTTTTKKALLNVAE